MAHARILLSSACSTVIHLPHARLVRSVPTASLAPWPAHSSPPSALLPLQRRQSYTSTLPLCRRRSTPLPPLRGRGGLAYPVRVFFNTTPGCRVRQPDERCRPVWTNRPPPSGEDRCVCPGTVSGSELARGTHTQPLVLKEVLGVRRPKEVLSRIDLASWHHLSVSQPISSSIYTIDHQCYSKVVLPMGGR